MREFHLLVEVLRARGYLTDLTDEVTPMGLRLAGIYTDVDLLVAEALEAGVLNGLGTADLAGFASLIVHEARRDDVEQPERLPTPALDRAATILGDIGRDLRRVEAEVGVRRTRELDAGFVAPIVRWAQGATLEDAIEGMDVSGGDFVRNVKQCIDLLGQLRDVADTASRTGIAAAMSALQRGIVDS